MHAITSHVDSRCINCGCIIPVNLSSVKISTLPLKCQEILKHWTKYEDLTNFKICIRCKNIIDEYSGSTDESIPDKRLGTVVCIGCGRAIRKKRVHKMTEERVAAATKYWPWFTIIQIDTSVCCHRCARRLQKIMEKERNEISNLESTVTLESTNELDSINCEPELSENGLNTEDNLENVSQSQAEKRLHMIVKRLSKNKPTIDSVSNSIILSDGIRLPYKLCSTHRGCSMNSNKVIPKLKHRMLATYYDIFAQKTARASSSCIHDNFVRHVSSDKRNFYNDFTVSRFESYVNEMKQGPALIDFENIEAMSDNICKYWTGIRVSEFLEMFESLKQPKLMKSALAVYLIRKITGDSVQKLAKLLVISSEKLIKQLRSVEKHFESG